MKVLFQLQVKFANRLCENKKVKQDSILKAKMLFYFREKNHRKNEKKNSQSYWTPNSP